MLHTFEQHIPCLNWIFAGYTGSKNPVQIRKKIQFIFQSEELQKSSADREGEYASGFGYP